LAQVVLRALDVKPSDSGARSAATFACPLCSTRYPNAEIWISFRRDVGYDADLPPTYTNKVRPQAYTCRFMAIHLSMAPV
jgi:uncharacterized protein (DUF2225 family)